MAETEAERRARLRETFGKKEEDSEDEEGDEAESKPKKSSKSKKKTPADRYAEEGEIGGKRTRGRPGTSDRLDVKRAPKKQDPGKLAEAVIAEAPPPLPVRNPGLPTAGVPDMAGVPLRPGPSGPGQDPISMLLEALRSIPMLGFSRMAPEMNRAGPLTAGSVAPFGNPFGSVRPPLPPLPSGPEGMFPPKPGGVSMQGASAAPTPRRVKTESVGPAEEKPKTKAKESVSKEKPKAKKKAKPKSSADRMADDMEKDNRGSSDYYEQLRSGRFRLGG